MLLVLLTVNDLSILILAFCLATQRGNGVLFPRKQVKRIGSVEFEHYAQYVLFLVSLLLVST